MSRMLPRALVAFACGAMFALGLTIAGMESPLTILNGFALSRSFDPRLSTLLLTSLAVHAPLAAWIRHRRGIRVEQGTVDTRLVLGSVLFGIGWGLGGVCPGPAVTAALTGTLHSTTFLVGLAAGIVLHHVAGARAVHQPRLAER